MQTFLKILGFVSLIVLTIALSMPFLLPNRLLWRLFEQDVRTLLSEYPAFGIRILNVVGVPREGSILIQNVHQQTSSIAWSLHLNSLLSGSIELDLRVTGDDHRLSTTLLASTRSQQIDKFEGVIGAVFLNPWLSSYGLSGTGEITITNGQGRIAQAWPPEQLVADALWPGGNVTYFSLERPELFVFPALRGNLAMASSTVGLAITDTASSRPLVEMFLSDKGWLTVNVRGWLFEIAGRSVPNNMSADQIVIEVEQLAFSGLEE